MPRLPYTKFAPDAYAALNGLGHYLTTATALEPVLLELVYLRASTLNGCHFCMGMHTAELRKHREPRSRIEAIADWQAPEHQDAFTLRERAALAWTDAITNIQSTHASDAEYAAVSEFFTGKDLVNLTFAIANINAWNRLSVAFGADWNPTRHAENETVPAGQTRSAVRDDGGKVAEDE